MKSLFIINPSSGRQNTLPKIEKIIGKLVISQVTNRIDVFYTKQKNDAFNKAKSLKTKSYDFVVACGGDGTVNEVIGGLIESQSDIPLAIIATGTVNDFATYLHLPSGVDGFVKMIQNFETKSVDIGKISNQYFANVVAGGAFSDIGFRVPKDKKAILGPLAYYVEGALAIPELFTTHLDLQITADGKKFDEKAILFLISNTQNIGGFTQIATQADISDGLFDGIIIRKCELTDMIALSKDILLNKHMDSPFLNYFQASHIEINAKQKDMPIDIDGERGPQVPIVIDNISKALRIIVPKRNK